MQVTVSDQEVIDQALKTVPLPKDVQVEFELHQDSTGGAAVTIWLGVRDVDAVSAKDQKRYNALAADLRQAVFASGVERFPYVRFKEARRRRA